MEGSLVQHGRVVFQKDLHRVLKIGGTAGIVAILSNITPSLSERERDADKSLAMSLV